VRNLTDTTEKRFPIIYEKQKANYLPEHHQTETSLINGPKLLGKANAQERIMGIGCGTAFDE
jgi:hypothetical protein